MEMIRNIQFMASIIPDATLGQVASLLNEDALQGNQLSHFLTGIVYAEGIPIDSLEFHYDYLSNVLQVHGLKKGIDESNVMRERVMKLSRKYGRTFIAVRDLGGDGYDTVAKYEFYVFIEDSRGWKIDSYDLEVRSTEVDYTASFDGIEYHDEW